ALAVHLPGVPRHEHRCLKARRQMDELRCRTGVHAELIHDGDATRRHVPVFSPRRKSEATQIALRPWSRISRATPSRSDELRSPASLISMGRLTPVMTSTRFLARNVMPR